MMPLLIRGVDAVLKRLPSRWRGWMKLAYGTARLIARENLSGGEQQRVALARALVGNPTRPAGRRADRQSRLPDR